MKRSGPLKRYTQLKRGGPLRKRSKRTARKERKAAGARRRWKNDVGCCMVCGHNSHHPWPDKPLQCSRLEAHEISNGSHRLKTIGEACCVLVACQYCNQHELTDKLKWPEARQLALLQAKAPERYNLIRYIELTSPNAILRITQKEVDAYKETIPSRPDA